MLSEQDLEFMRESHEALMYDTVKITRPSEESVWDEESRTLIDSPGEVLYRGKARVALDKVDAILIPESGSTINRTTGFVTIPVDSVPYLLEGDVVEVTSRSVFPTLYVTSVGEDSFMPACIRFAVVTDRGQVRLGGA